MYHIVTPWGKYQYLRLPMGVNVSPDVFQGKMCNLIQDLEYVRTYLDDLLVISNGSFEEHLYQLGVQIEYLGYLPTKDGINQCKRKSKQYWIYSYQLL